MEILKQYKIGIDYRCEKNKTFIKIENCSKINYLLVFVQGSS